VLADTHTVLSCTAGQPPVDRCCATTTIGRAPHSPQTRALSFDTPQLLSSLCLHRGMLGSTPTCTTIHSRPHVAASAYDAAAAAAGMPAVCLYFS